MKPQLERYTAKHFKLTYCVDILNYKLPFPREYYGFLGRASWLSSKNA